MENSEKNSLKNNKERFENLTNELKDLTSSFILLGYKKTDNKTFEAFNFVKGLQNELEDVLTTVIEDKKDVLNLIICSILLNHKK